MAFPWPLDKLTVINSGLAATGDNTVAMADDGSDEWNVCSPAYDRALSYIMESHGWGYARLTKALQPSPTAPDDTDFDTAYPIPADCVHIIWVKINQATSSTVNLTTAQLTLYDIRGTPNGPVIVINAKGGPPPPPNTVTPATVTLSYISNAGALCDVTNGTPTLVASLQLFVEAAIFQGLHEDVSTAQLKMKEARGVLQEARTRYDQQKPKRGFWNSRITASRRIRRPWPPTGMNSWGSGAGSGTPG